ncbi:MAG: hypothetical protein D6731_06770, partial [Planctomycetota bacterium]
LALLPRPDFPGAVASAREAIARAPGRATAHMQLAWLLLDPRRPARSETERAEGWARAALALELGPTLPRLLLAAGELEIGRGLESGDEGAFLRARALLARAVRREPRLRGAVLGRLEGRRAQLGAHLGALREAVERTR